MMSSVKAQLILALLFLGCMLAGYGVWYATVSAKSAQAAELANEIATKQADATRLRMARVALETVGAEEAILDRHLVSTADVVPFLESLQATGASLGSAVTIVSVAAHTSTAHPALSLSLHIVGSFSSVLRTLGAVEYAPYYVTVDNLSLTAATGAASTTAPWSADAALTVGTSIATSTPLSASIPAAPMIV